MSTECWTLRYSGTRAIKGPLSLRAPIARSWKYKAKEPGLGFIRVGDGSVFTNMGDWVATKHSLDTGKVIWRDPSGDHTGMLARWSGDIVADGIATTRLLNKDTGEIIWRKEIPNGIGTNDSYVVGNLVVGYIAGEFRVVELPDLRFLWSVPDTPTNPLVGNDRVVIRADEDITCYELLTGKVRWHHSKEELGGKPLQMGFIWNEQFIVRAGPESRLTSFDVETGKKLWVGDDQSFFWTQPYGDYVYGFGSDGKYSVLDLKAGGKTVMEKHVGRKVPQSVKGKKSGLRVVRGGELPLWRNVRVAVSETHAFLANESGQIVILERDTGELVQIVELDGMPILRHEPIVYENRLLIADFNASVYCFEGAQ